MKKLLGILGTITIAGSGMSEIGANVSSKIDENKNNNLENLNRAKRDPNLNIGNKNIIIINKLKENKKKTTSKIKKIFNTSGKRRSRFK